MTGAARQRLAIGALLVAAVVAALAWLASVTQWQDMEIPRAPSGKAAEDEHYALQRLAQGVGAQTVARERLEPFPPARATLLLGSWSWDTFPERDRALRTWVEHGGNLVMSYWAVASLARGRADAPGKAAGAAAGDKSVRDARDWIPVRMLEFKPDARRKAAPAQQPAAPVGAPADRNTTARKTARSISLLPQPICRTLREASGMPPTYPEAPPGSAAPLPDAGPGGRAEADPAPAPAADDEVPATPDTAAADDGERRTPGLRLCSSGLFGPGLMASAPVWALGDTAGLRLVRVAVGAGSVTIVQDPRIFDNAGLLQGDNALIDAAALQLRAGAELWVVDGDGRAQILAWLWARAPLAVAGALLALGLWLWRALPRFGPRAEPAATARRSMIEQIRGTAHFLWRRDPAALHAAQRRALDEAAARRIRDYARLDLSDRAEAVARRTGLARSTLLQALAIDRAPDARSLPRQLAVLESARRALQREAPAVPQDSRREPP